MVWIPILVSVVGAMGGIWRRSVKQAVELQVLRAENGELRDGLASVREEMKATAKIRAETLRRLRGENAVLHDEVNSLKSELISNAASRERLHNEINVLRRSFTKGGATQ